MKRRERILAMVLLAVLLAGLGLWWWSNNMELRWIGRYQPSRAAEETPMLAATRLLRRHGHVVQSERVLGEALQKPLQPGVLFVQRQDGVMRQGQFRTLLEWVRQGNTLILRPKPDANYYGPGRVAGQPLAEADQLGAYLGVSLKARAWRGPPGTRPLGGGAGKAPNAGEGEEGADAEDGQSGRIGDDGEDGEGGEASEDAGDGQGDRGDQAGQGDQAAQPGQGGADGAAGVDANGDASIAVRLPGSAYRLDLDRDTPRLFARPKARAPLFSDTVGEAVRVYGEGNGHIVLLASNYFDNQALGRRDHAELLLGLVGLDRSGSQPPVLIVQGVEMPSWFKALWDAMRYPLVSLACLLALLLWAAARRFGPLLPEAGTERRAMMEHVQASGRWLWKLPQGRALLLAGARAATQQVLQRRVPGLSGFQPGEQAQLLAQACRLPSAEVAAALHHPAAATPHGFTRQIQTLQQLRKHYERQHP